MRLILLYFMAKHTFKALFLSISLVFLSTKTSAQEATGGAPLRVPIISVSQEILRLPENYEVCWPVIVSERTLAERAEAKKSWVTRHWQQILGGLVGAAAGYQLTTNYSSFNSGWTWPTIALGTTLGVIGLPGFAGLAYGGGALGMTQWPGKLPLTIGLSLGGGILGSILWKMLFPPNPLLQQPGPGEFMAFQNFSTELQCALVPVQGYTEGAYRVVYRFNGQEQTAQFQYDPGKWIFLDDSGAPIGTLAEKTQD